LRNNTKSATINYNAKLDVTEEGKKKGFNPSISLFWV